MYENGFSINNLQWFVCHKTKPSQSKLDECLENEYPDFRHAKLDQNNLPTLDVACNFLKYLHYSELRYLFRGFYYYYFYYIFIWLFIHLFISDILFVYTYISSSFHVFLNVFESISPSMSIRLSKIFITCHNYLTARIYQICLTVSI